MLLCSISFFVLFTWWASNCYKGHYATTLGFFACTAYETILLTEQGGVTQPHSEGNITGPIANILYGEVVKKKRDPILPPIGSNIGNPNKFDTSLTNKQTFEYAERRKIRDYYQEGVGVCTITGLCPI